MTRQGKKKKGKKRRGGKRGRTRLYNDIYMTITSAQGRVPRDLCDHQRKKKHTHNNETSVVVTVR